MNIVNVGYASTNYYVVEQDNRRLLIDVGMPGTFAQLRANLKRAGIALRTIGYLLITHYHPDHAGIVEEVKAEGVHLVVPEPQQGAAEQMLQRYIKAGAPFTPIRQDNNIAISLATSRRFLQTAGFAGEIIHTPGHSDDSVSIVFDDGNAFIGDLTLPALADETNRAQLQTSWQRLADLKVKAVFSGHAPPQYFARIMAEQDLIDWSQLDDMT